MLTSATHRAQADDQPEHTNQSVEGTQRHYLIMNPEEDSNTLFILNVNNLKGFIESGERIIKLSFLL